MQEIREQLKKVIQDLYDLDFDPEITSSPDNIDADYSSNAPLKLAKILHKPPMDIGGELLKAFVSICDNGSIRRSDPRNDGRERGGEQKVLTTPPGFLNFTLSDDFLSDAIDNLHDNFDQAISSSEFKGQTVICEFSDPNPFKVLHVGHLYTSIVGDSIARLHEYAGAKVVRANFGGDVGLHVAKTMYILQQKDPQNLTIEDIAKCYIEGTTAYDSDEAAREEITKLNKEIYQINATGEPKESSPIPKLADLYWKGRELSYDYFRDFYNQIGVKFDKYYPESTVADLGLAKVREQLEKGVYEISDGAVIFNGDKYGLHTRVFINKEGIPTYEAKDVGLIFTKWQDYHFDKSIVITGAEQKDYMSVVLKSVEQYAPKLVERTTHLTHGLVKLPGGVKMSSRKGNFLKAVDVLDMVSDALKSEFNSTDPTVSLAATKYAFLKYKMGGNIIFDPHESVKMTGNSGPYLLYSCVRARKILAKSHSARVVDNVFLGDISRFSSPETYIPDGLDRFACEAGGSAGVPAYDVSGEKVRPRKDMSVRPRADRNLMKKLLEYRSLLSDAVTEMAPHKVANYLYELAQEFSRFYEHYPVVGSDQETERLQLVKIYLSVMTHGLGLLGITIPEKM